MNWLYTLWFGYVWPSLKGNGPEAVVQTVVYAAGAYVLWPPFRKVVNAWMHGHLSAHTAELHKKLDHIIAHHPDIPPLP